MLKKAPLICFLLLWGVLISHHSIAAQLSKLDSLIKLLHTAKQDTEKINILNNLGLEYENEGQYQLSDSMAGQALQLANKINFEIGKATAYKILATTNQDRGNYVPALDNFSKALAIRKELKDKPGIAATLNRIGLVYKDEGNYQKALDNFREAMNIYMEINYKHDMAFVHGNIGEVYIYQGKYPDALNELLSALKVFEEAGDKRGMANTHENIGNVYNNQKDFARALEEYQNALKLNEELNNRRDIANSLSNIGLVYVEQNNDSLALIYHNKALVIRTDIGDKNGIAISLINIGGIYFGEKKYSQALDYFNRSLNIFQTIGNKDGIANCLDGISQIYIEQKKYPEALAFEDKSLDLNKEIGSLEGIETANQMFSNIYDSMGNDKKAFKYYKDYISARDSLFNQANTKKSVESEMNFQFEKKQAIEKADEEKRNEIQIEQQRKQKLIIYFISGFLLLVVGFAIFAYRSYLQKQKVNQELAEKNKDILDSITYAKRLQDAILPPLSLIKQYLPESFVLYKPKDIVAGDFYWMEKVGDIILIAAADCTGHGVPGALVSVVCSNALNRTVKEFKITEPGKILDKVRELVLETFEKSENNVQDGMDISLAAISYQPIADSFSVQWSGAYNSLWYINNGTLLEVAADKQPIGKNDNPKSFNTHSLNLRKGSILYLFTDGYADQFGGPKGKKFKYKQLEEKLLAISHQPLPEQKQNLEKVFDAWKGSLEQVDDVLVMGVRV
jgi:tetratricopeptide (TPR) repeat protein